VVLVQRDHGDRTNRKHARLKYTIEDHGVEWFKTEVENRLGYKLEAARPFKFSGNGDRYGWTQGTNGKWNLTLFVEGGRVRDTEALKMKTCLREVAKVHTGDFRLTGNQNLVIGNVEETEKGKIEAILKEFNFDQSYITSGMRLSSIACVALPTCGLSMAESERYLPTLVTKLEKILEEVGLFKEEIVIRMTGCPNGCGRPYLGEIAFIGKAPGKYNMYLGAGFVGDRLNKLYKENIGEEEILESLDPIIRDFAKSREEGEKFGDFVIRKGYIKETTAGNNFHD
jgi:sulfite reductase (NADPH) hemoprotein beta-component